MYLLLCFTQIAHFVRSDKDPATLESLPVFTAACILGQRRLDHAKSGADKEVSQILAE